MTTTLLARMGKFIILLPVCFVVAFYTSVRALWRELKNIEEGPHRYIESYCAEALRCQAAKEKEEGIRFH